MSLLSVDRAAYSNHAGTLFENVSFAINEGDHIGLIGNNGCGKSTLLKAIMGELELSKGSIQKQRGIKIGYIAQSVPERFENMTLYEVLEDAIPPAEREYSQYKVDMALEALGAEKEIYDCKMFQLSGGWRRLALIARTNLDDPDLLILDEPTNHLDVGKIMHLENWLKDTVFVPYLVVSHDRQFLDNCTDKTLIMRAGKVHSYKYSITRAKELLAEDDFANARERKERQKEIDRLAQTAKQFKIKGQAHGSERLSRVAKTLESRIEKMEEALPDVHQEKDRNIALGRNELEYNKPVLKISNLDVKTPTDQFLFHIDNLSFSKGERAAILGLNGTGKSVFIRELMKAYDSGKKSPFGGSTQDPIYFNPQVVVGYVDQELTILPPEENLQDFIQGRFSLDRTRAIRELVQAGFSINEQEAKIKTLSFGQKVRMAFLLLKNEQPNFYIMDEPTNHLDIDGQERLEKAILERDNPCVLVSHDRRLISNVANSFYVIENARLKRLNSAEEFFTKSYENQDIQDSQTISSKKKINLQQLKDRGRE
ncbi:MAG: ABC-F family ATP-binding cassette domain-containing protein [Alphaproteobacteria bacterium]|nr:ABC-F family ATP-binding cassette domain-containing protein [Alphaproteobacteria bacterium]